MIVLDTSALLDVLIGRPASQSLLARLARDDDLHAPHLIDIEVLHALRRLVRTSVVRSDRAAEARADLAELSITRYPLGSMADRVWELRGNLTAYDAAFVALAEALGASLITCDRRLAKASSHRARVEVY
ncbi:MAG: type II toxin-antitoxin system VapC family toxin [Nocardioidaceae bacterium]|nr:type II toxin-antitoxin system VapC family toxin [Nocardioidaceae bacterium]